MPHRRVTAKQLLAYVLVIALALLAAALTACGGGDNETIVQPASVSTLPATVVIEPTPVEQSGAEAPQAQQSAGNAIAHPGRALGFTK